jgi:hypothetical protein
MLTDFLYRSSIFVSQLLPKEILVSLEFICKIMLFPLKGILGCFFLIFTFANKLPKCLFVLSVEFAS